jgi:hypothetical protein
VFLSKPTEDECGALIARHIDKGKFNDVALEGQGGAEITITNHPLCIAPGNPAVTARSKKLSYKDHGMSRELSGKNGFFSPFQYAA